MFDAKHPQRPRYLAHVYRLMPALIFLGLQLQQCKALKPQLPPSSHFSIISTKYQPWNLSGPSLPQPLSALLGSRCPPSGPIGGAGTLRMHGWEGDDLRWSTKLRRRFRRMSVREGGFRDTPVKALVMLSILICFLYQTLTTVNFIRLGHPEFWPSHALSMIGDAFIGSTLAGPLTRDFAFSNALALIQPHRYLTSGFFHPGVFHLLFNLDAMRRQPSWLETGLGWSLYLTTFVLTIITGNLGIMLGNDPLERSLCIGASGGISGLYGLMYASLVKMGNKGAFGRTARGMAILMFGGVLFENVNTLMHIGGFLGGVLIAILFSPSYKKNYSLRRKNSVEFDPAPRDFRQAMGFGLMPTDRGLIPLPLLWIVLSALLVFANPKYHTMPELVLKGLLHPGSLLR